MKLKLIGTKDNFKVGSTFTVNSLDSTTVLITSEAGDTSKLFDVKIVLGDCIIVTGNYYSYGIKSLFTGQFEAV